MTFRFYRTFGAAVSFLSLFAFGAHATGPALTPVPKPATRAACQTWAASQDEDAIYMWGTIESGAHPKDVALSRFTDFCLGRHVPDIVYFGSSAGFNEAYCAKHATAKICNARLTTVSGKSTASTKLGKSDLYAGCIFSIAIPLMHNGVNRQSSSEIAFKRCSKYSSALEETELEGVGDYVNLTLDKLSSK